MRYKLYKEQNKLRLNKNQGKEKLIMKAVLTMFSAVLLAAAAMAAETVAPAGITDWVFTGKSLSYKNGIGIFNGYMLSSRGFIPVDPSKKYIVEGEFRTAEKSKPAKFQLGMVSLDGQRRVIRPNTVIVVPGSGAVLVKAAPAGSTKITVKTIHKWNPKIKAHIVAGADNSGKFSDLPNFDLVGKVAKVTVTDGKILDVELAAPLTRNLPAGENIRLHSDGGVHVCSKPVTVGKEWQKFSHVIGGYSKGHTTTQFRHGAKYAKIFILHHKGSVLEFRNITLKEAK